MSQEPPEVLQLPSSSLSKDTSCSYIYVTVKEEVKDETPISSVAPLPEDDLTNTDKQIASKYTEFGEEASGDHNAEFEMASVSPLLHLDSDCGADGDLQGSLFPCEHCQRRFTTRQGLERHVHIHAPTNSSILTYKCCHCGKPFGSQIGRRRHERRHENGSLVKRPVLAPPLGPLLSNASSPDSAAVQCMSDITCSHNGAEPEEGSPTEKMSIGPQEQQASFSEDNGAVKDVHPCKYCKKVFGTHTNMRRHQRRIHERHLLSKGVQKKGLLLQTSREQQTDQQTPEESQSAASPPVYLPSQEAEEDVEHEAYMVDVSNNISENLNLYIDGKILSTSTVSNCEVIELNSRPATLFGLEAFIISPQSIGQAIKIGAPTCTVNDVPSQSDQPLSKRRTATPPIPNIKSELDAEPVTSSVSAFSLPSASSPTIAGTHSSQPTEVSAIQKDKTVYLSPKLKQLLQNQDNHKPILALITDSHRLGPPPPINTLTATTGRFKRRTASPPNVVHCHMLNFDSLGSEAGSSQSLKVPKLESCSSTCIEDLSTNPSEVDAFKMPDIDWSFSRSGGNSCNQQPLDLSSSVSKKTVDLSCGLGEVVLDLSINRRTSDEHEAKGDATSQLSAKKRKPNTCMLEKVLMNEYGAPEGPVEDSVDLFEASNSLLEVGTSTACTFDSQFINHEMGSVGLSVSHPSPPSLTPITVQPFSSFTAAVGSPTPPPPVLPTAPSPSPVCASTEPHSVCSTTYGSFPVLHSTVPPGPSEIREPDSDMTVPIMANCGTLNLLAPPQDPPFEVKHYALPINPTADQMALQVSSEYFLAGSAPSTCLVDGAQSFSIIQGAVFIECTLSIESSQNLITTCVANPEDAPKPPDGNTVDEHAVRPAEEQNDFSCSPEAVDPPPDLSDSSQELAAPLSPCKVKPESPPTPVLHPTSLTPVLTESEPRLPDEASTSDSQEPIVSSTLPSPETPDKMETFSKNFTCNVCKKPFGSIKQLSHHISEHAEQWPFKCEFCVLVFENADTLLEHRSSLHGVAAIYVCNICSKEFAFLCNLQQHHKDLHPGENCSHKEAESGKLRPQNYNGPKKAKTPSIVVRSTSIERDVPSRTRASGVKKEEEVDDSEELYTTIKIMASEGVKPKGPNVRLGINQLYPSFKPPPFPYHNRTPPGSVASATNFTTHNIPQRFSTAIRCTKCGKSFDNMPELHRHILACANASDKKRYTPKKNPIPLKQFAKIHLGTVSNGQNLRRMVKRLSFDQDLTSKARLHALKKKNHLIQKAISQKNKLLAIGKKDSFGIEEEQEVHVCPHCNREFTYQGSLSKHMAVSCPMKSSSRKNGKAKDHHLPLSLEPGVNLRRRATDSQIKQQESKLASKTLGKTRSQSSGQGNPSPFSLRPLPSKARIVPQQLRPKRPASLPPGPVPFSKRSKAFAKGTISSSALAPASVLHRQPSRMQYGVKEVAPKNVEGKLRHPQFLPKRAQNVSLNKRKWLGGPVTRSLQLVPGERKGELMGNAELKELKDPLLKLAG